LQERGRELKASNIRPVVVTFEAGFLARAYVQDTGLEWPLLVDEKRNLYRAYDMLKASLRDLWGPATLWAYGKEIMRGRWPQKSSGDISQRGGDVLIDPAGVIRLHHIGRTPADRPPVERILEIVNKVKNSNDGNGRS
jgi:alkyl hydroperoxide reductase subunit AhpC